MDVLNQDFQTVIFTLGKEEYGIDIGKVQEIIRLPDITKLPNTEQFVLGIINLRGNIIPVIDLKKKFLGSSSDITNETRIIVVEVDGKKLGLLVDEVSEVIKVPANCLVTSEAIGGVVSGKHLLGVAKIDERLLLLLDTDKVF